MTTSSTSLSKVPVTTPPDSQMGPLTEVELAEAWFDAPPPSTRRTPVPPPPVSVVGEFLGDPLADSWLR
jgi:hypothetical protein